MSALDNIPDNKNFLSAFGFKFQIKKTPNLNFFVQSVNIPGISLVPLESPNPFVKIPYSGDHIDFSNISLTFKVDEDLENYLEIHNWIRQLGFPEDFSQYKQIAAQPLTSGLGIVSDISIMILSSSRNPKFEVVFKDAFPVSLSDLTFNTTNPDVDYIEATAAFSYTSFNVEKL